MLSYIDFLKTCIIEFVFFFKQKTADEISLRLVGSEMCMRIRTQGEETDGREAAHHILYLSLIPIGRCRRHPTCRSRWFEQGSKKNEDFRNA